MFYALFFLSNEVEHDNLISVLILSLGMKSKSALPFIQRKVHAVGSS